MYDFSSWPTFGAPVRLINGHPDDKVNGADWALTITDDSCDESGTSTIPHCAPLDRDNPDFYFRFIGGRQANQVWIQNLVSQRIVGRCISGRVDMGWPMTGGVGMIDTLLTSYSYYPLDFFVDQPNTNMLCNEGGIPGQSGKKYLEGYTGTLQSPWHYQWMGVQVYEWSQGGSANQRWGWEYVFTEGSRLRINDAFYLVLDGLVRHVPNAATHDQLWEDWNRTDVKTYPERNKKGTYIPNKNPNWPGWQASGRTYDGTELFWKPSETDLSDGTYLARDVTNGKVYLVSNGQKRWISSADVFNKFHFGWSKVHDLQPSKLTGITTGPDIK